MKTQYLLTRLVFALVCLLHLVSCESELMVSSPGKPVSAITSLDRLSVKPGDEVVVSGRNLTTKITVDVGGKLADLKLSDKKNGSFILPDDTSPGLVQVVFKKGEISIATFPLLNGDNLEEVPISVVPLASVCDSYIVKDKNGDLQRGEAKCGEQLPVCTSDGETNCRATDDYPVSQKAGLAAKILIGQTVAGVSGAATLRPANCVADGSTDCVAVAAFPAADKSAFTASDLRSGLTVAGITGSLVGAPVACSADGQTSCLAYASFVSANVSGAAAKILTGQTLAGIAGTGAIRPSDCAVDGGTNCVAVANFPAIDKVNSLQANVSQIRSGLTLAGVAGTLANCSVDGGAGCVAVGPTYAAALTTGAAAKIITGQSLAGVAGSGLGKPADCTSDGGIGCVTVSNFPAVDRVTNLSAAKRLKIHPTVTVGGVAGTLADCSVDGGEDCFANFAFPAASVSGAAAKIVTGQTLAGVSGTATAAPANCAADGATNCVAVALFPAIDKATKLSVGNAGKIHSSLTIAGVVGTLADCAADGGTNCLAVSAFPAANVTAAAAKILTGQTLAGISGSGALRPSDCASDGGTDCVAVALFPAVDKATKLSVGNAAKIHSTLSIAGVTGTMASCSADGGTDCMAVAGYPAANTTGAAAKIALGDVLAGVTGTAGVRPSDCVSDGSTGCVATATYPAANSTGAAAKIASGDVLAGITGTAGVRPSDCSSDGATGCVAVTNFPAIDKLTKLSVGNAARIRSSLTIAGVVGTLDDCSTDGSSGCVVVGPTYAAAITAGVAAKVLTGQSVAGISGSATPAPANCAADGATNCVAVANFPAVNKVTNLAALNLAKISSSVTVGGVVGTMADCSADGTTGCLTVTAFPSANTSGAAAKIISGQTLAGVSGSATAAPANCAADGATNCVAVALFPAVDKATKLSAGNAARIRSSLTIAGVVGTLDDCATDGGSGCVVTGPTYVSALTTGAAAKILSGQSIAGVSGSAAARPSDCASDGEVNCVAITNFPAVNKVTNLAAPNLAMISSSVTVGGVVGTLANCSTDGTTSCLTVSGFPSANTTGAAAKILTGQTLAGVSGSATAAPSNCSSDGQINCVAITTYPALQKSLLTAAVLKNGTVINGVTGAYPNATYPLAGSTVAADLTAATFKAQVKSSTAFEYFDSSGNLQTGAGDVDITGAKIASGIDIFSSTGTFGPDCTADGQTACLTTSTYKSANTSSYDEWSIRDGMTIGGVTGKIAFYRSGADLSFFNRTTGSGTNSSGSVVDEYDSIDDLVNDYTAAPYSFPTAVPSGWPSISAATNWLATGSGGVYMDRITLQYWAPQGPGDSWDNSVIYCNDLSLGGYTDWRLPTQKEMLQVFINGLWSQAANLNLNTHPFWTATTVSTGVQDAWVFDPNSGWHKGILKTSTTELYQPKPLCTRP